MLTKKMKANLGIMITASHNPFHDNGLKLFGPDGMKLSDQIEKKIENLIDTKTISHLSDPKSLGRVKRLEDGNDRYIKILKENFPSDFSLKGMRIVLDCANGAGYKSAPKILSKLGARVFSIGIKPNGLNINTNCGSTFPEVLRKHVKKFKADIGIALDGDADRVIMCDERSQIIDGDQIIAMIAKRWKRKKILKGGVIGTLMSNYGLEKFFLNENINFKRSNVGDRYVKEMMKKNSYNLGGEQSGHIILGKFATTGDGLLVALEILFALRKGKLASEMFKVYKSVPQKLLNIKVKDKKIFNSYKCKKAIKIASKLIKNKGRLLVRPSGTEPKIRIMCESFNVSLMNKCISIVKETIN
jgi:phosphoglucosamine mutase